MSNATTRGEVATPVRLRVFLRSFGPGLLWAGTAIGVSHLVQATGDGHWCVSSGAGHPRRRRRGSWPCGGHPFRIDPQVPVLCVRSPLRCGDGRESGRRLHADRPVGRLALLRRHPVNGGVHPCRHRSLYGVSTPLRNRVDGLDTDDRCPQIHRFHLAAVVRALQGTGRRDQDRGAPAGPFDASRGVRGPSRSPLRDLEPVAARTRRLRSAPGFRAGAGGLDAVRHRHFRLQLAVDAGQRQGERCSGRRVDRSVSTSRWRTWRRAFSPSPS